MGGAKRVLAILLGVVVMAMISGCGLVGDEASGPQPTATPQFAENEAIAVVVDSITQGGEGRNCIRNGFSEKYIGNGTWKVKGFSGSWKVYEDSLKALPDHNALVACY